MKKILRVIPLIALILILALALSSCDAFIDNFLSSLEGETGPESVVDLTQIPTFDGYPYVIVNNNVPFFTAEEITAVSFEKYSPLDALGRCGVAVASVGIDLMPTEERGSIGSVKPSGWQTVKYDCVNGKYLYNRCHLIGYQLTGENANELNLITGTRFMNVDGMLPFENMIAAYVKETENHVMYRVTPIYSGNNPVAHGVLMEAYSVEDEGDGINFNVYVYNNQPGVRIDYTTGNSKLDDGIAFPEEDIVLPDGEAPEIEEEGEQESFIINTSTEKYHKHNCRYVGDTANFEEYTGLRTALEDAGYEACKVCNP